MMKAPPDLIKKMLPKTALFTAALIWGSSFAMMKNAVDVYPPNMLLAMRFSVACALLCVVFRKRLTAIDSDYLRKTALIGLCLFAAYSFQTFGIRLTTPGKNAFLTSVYVVIVPFIYWVTAKRRPSIANIAAALICLTGIGLISLESPASVPSAAAADFQIFSVFSINAGDALTLIGGVFYAAHIVCLGVLSRGKDPVLLTILQFAYCALLFSICAVVFESPPPAADTVSLLTVLYLAVFCTAAAMLCQNFGQKYTAPSSASLIMSLEAVFGAAFSAWFYGETFTPRVVAGFVLVFAAIVISEAAFSQA